MRQHADEIFTLRDIDLDFNAPVLEQDLKLGMNVRRDLLLVFKEAVNNVARHAKCSRVAIDFAIDGDKAVIAGLRQRSRISIHNSRVRSWIGEHAPAGGKSGGNLKVESNEGSARACRSSFRDKITSPREECRRTLPQRVGDTRLVRTIFHVIGIAS
jgi:two-component sensor histidine kinase